MLNTFRKNSVNQQTATTPQVINAPDMNLQLESLNNRINVTFVSSFVVLHDY